mmetsp:Transcript_37387/g.116208  ORF Transcript_37387/g.116208 Transcript_37387/m.116208 type:complete len:226 (+) Transcript_37387:369-1046(+)
MVIARSADVQQGGMGVLHRSALCRQNAALCEHLRYTRQVNLPVQRGDHRHVLPLLRAARKLQTPRTLCRACRVSLQQPLASSQPLARNGRIRLCQARPLGGRFTTTVVLVRSGSGLASNTRLLCWDNRLLLPESGLAGSTSSFRRAQQLFQLALNCHLRVRLPPAKSQLHSCSHRRPGQEPVEDLSLQIGEGRLQRLFRVRTHSAAVKSLEHRRAMALEANFCVP